MSRFPRLIVALGGLFVLFAVGRVAYTAESLGMRPDVAFDTALLIFTGLVFLYVGLKLPASDIEPRHYPHIVAWFLGGIGVMFGFLVLREIHPAVDADWTIGTQAIAFTIGSVGGLLIGIQRTRAITRTQQLQARNRELDARKRELAHQNCRLENVIGIISHDLRSPLSATSGWILLAETENSTEYLPKATSALDRMGEIIENTLALARHGEAVVAPEPFSLSEIATECWEIAGSATAEVTVVDDAVLWGDRERVKHVFENLFRNAVDHAGSSVSVRTGLIGMEGIYIEDDGPGIPATACPDIFTSGYTTTEGGTGFGLAIVAEIVDAHDWAIRLAEDAGGARFEITGMSLTPTPETDDAMATSDRQRAL
jgi:signal transduction histidine kinase